jgi:hypothetical protein
MIGRGLALGYPTRTIFGSIRINPCSKLTESLELVKEFMKYVKGPFGQEEKRCESRVVFFGVFSLCDEEVKEVLIDFPSLDAITDRGTGDGVEVSLG